jgi:hypothetical protein
MKLEEGEYLAHYGILRKSGRYPWGSGKNPLQRSKTFLDIIKEHEREGMSEAEIAKLYNVDDERGRPTFTSKHVRALKTRAGHIQKEDQIRTALALQDKKMSKSEAARQMGINESTYRSLIEPGRLEKLNELQNVADMLKRQVNEKGMIDVGAHVQRDLPIGDNPDVRVGVSKDKFDTALIMLAEEGYPTHTFDAPQQGTGEKTKYRVLCKPGTTSRDAFVNRANVQLITEKSDDGGKSFRDAYSFKKPLNVDSKRVAVRYKEDGGADSDGVIFVRPGVSDVSLGKNHYAQVRVAVDGTHYLKGMAIYKTDLPPGVDLMFNTNKSATGNKLDALKPLKKKPLLDANGNPVKEKGKVVDSDEVDWSNPFGSFPKIEGGQLKDEKGNVTSSMNILNEMGDWNNWSRNLSSQVLSKQSPDLAKSQLDLTYERRLKEFNEIKALQNPLIKKKLLESFADETDSAGVHLQAANMPRQATKVLMPTPSVKPDEVFAPTFNNGERVALVRFPHAGRFEIPELTVNNKNREAIKLFSQGKELMAPDAIGIHPKVAERLSGADFDGDHVVVIPNKFGVIKSDPALEGLKGFDPQRYKVPTPEEDPVNGRETIDAEKKGNQMGRVTNLISDMTIKGANSEDLADAVKHSMVVIDAEKHNLDWKASERDHRILALKKRYQGVHEKTGQPKGAATLITRANSDLYVNKRKARLAKDGGPIDPATGRKMFVPTDELNSKGKEKQAQGLPLDPKKDYKTFKSKKLAETHDAFTLIDPKPGTEIERVYAVHSNKLKALANEARKEWLITKPTRRNPSAAETYKKEVDELKAHLDEALRNAPYERRAQLLAGAMVGQRKQANPDMDASDMKKIRAQSLNEARIRTGAKKHRIEITDEQWKAIQAGAISIDGLTNILRNTDVDKLRERATPHTKPTLSPAMAARARNMKNMGATEAEIADALDVSVSTLASVFSG